MPASAIKRMHLQIPLRIPQQNCLEKNCFVSPHPQHPLKHIYEFSWIFHLAMSDSWLSCQKSMRVMCSEQNKINWIKQCLASPTLGVLHKYWTIFGINISGFKAFVSRPLHGHTFPSQHQGPCIETSPLPKLWTRSWQPIIGGLPKFIGFWLDWPYQGSFFWGVVPRFGTYLPYVYQIYLHVLI